jgi:hypothetical protein
MNTEVYMRAVSFLFAGILTLFANVASADDLTGTDAQIGYSLETVNPQDQDFIDDFVLQVVSCELAYDMRQPDEPLTYIVNVNLVADENPLLASYTATPDGNEQIWLNGKWIRFDMFVKNLATECVPAPNS